MEALSKAVTIINKNQIKIMEEKQYTYKCIKCKKYFLNTMSSNWKLCRECESIDSIWNPIYQIEISIELIEQLKLEYAGNNLEQYENFLYQMKKDKMVYNTKRKTFMSKPKTI
jgi:ribosomal protein L37AE/L43A